MKTIPYRPLLTSRIIAIISLACIVSIARAETKIVNFDDTGFLHIQETKSNSTTDDHFIKLSHIVYVGIKDEGKDGFFLKITTTTQSVGHFLEFKTREEAQATVKRLLETIGAGG